MKGNFEFGLLVNTLLFYLFIAALGRAIRGFDDNLWRKHRINIVLKGNMLKFQQNPELRKYLLSTQGRDLYFTQIIGQ